MLANITFRIRTLCSMKILLLRGNRLPPGGEMDQKQSRRRTKQLHVPVLPDEIADIKCNAEKCGLSVAAYLRELGLRHHPKSILDANAVLELAKVNGDLGRLGGLLKMWLTNDDRLKTLGKERVVPMINGILEEIKTAQAVLLETARKI